MSTVEHPVTKPDVGDPFQLPASIFRAYDIRGIAYEELSYDRVALISQAIGSEALALGIDTLLLGYDGRLSSPELSLAVKEGILRSGCNVVDLGLIPTPLLYFATHISAHDSGVMLTASHNPADYNGLKIVFNKTCLADNQIQGIKRRIERRELLHGEGGESTLDVCPTYLDTVAAKIRLRRKMRIVVDCGNAVPGKLAPSLFERLGCDVLPLFCDIDGRFPNHHPDPTIPANLHTLATQVISHHADLGIAFDGDGDRLGIVTNRGEFVDADSIMMLLVKDIAPRYPNEPIIFDVKCSSRLAQLISQMGAKPIMHRSGHSFMKQKMQETQAPLGGEFSAHIFINDDWFGYDDGLYVAARVLEVLSRVDHSASQEFATNTDWVSTGELKLPVSEASKFRLMADIIERASFPGANIITMDGLRVEYEDGWGLIRASNTSPALLLRFEANSSQRLNELMTHFKGLIASADSRLSLDF